ncbi:glycosyltransferase 61 family protein [Azospirillum sp.]|uniref:glycosyltransferase 61 family protein n=1 Tax=Azospirillum sp. TaxID=34012 RepID=UPI0026291FEE|nr:glycosyltransferase 61 family protein [Azospirillum sp.]
MTRPASPSPSSSPSTSGGDMTVGEALRLALEHERDGRLHPAEALAAAIVGAVPNHADALALLAALRLRRGEEGEALLLLARAVAHAGADAPFFANVGSLLRRAGSAERALAAQKRALALDPAFAVAWFNLANTQNEGAAAPSRDAAASYARAARLLPHHPDPCRRLAESRLALGEPAEALEPFTQSLRLAPESIPARLGMIDALRALGRIDGALALCRSVLALRPESAEGLTSLGALLVDDGRAGGIPPLRRLARLAPDDAVGRLALGEALARAGAADARAALQRALALRPADPRSLRVFGGRLFDDGDDAGAISWRRRRAALEGTSSGRVAVLRVQPASHATGAAHQPVSPLREMAVDTGTARWGEITYRLPESFLTRVDEALVHPHNFTVETPDGALLLDGLHAYSRSSLTMLPHVVHHSGDDRLLVDLPPTVERVGEEAILLGGDGNFAHGALDWASKLCVLDQFPHLSDLPVLVSAALRPAVVELFGLLGLSAERLIRVTPGAVLSCRRLWVPSLTHQFQYMAPEHLAFLRGRLGIPSSQRAPGRGRRLYLTRASAGYRGLVNEEEVAALLAAEGFEAYVPDGRSMAEQIAAFAQAEAIVAPIGGGTAAVAFAPPGTRVLELTHERCVLPQYAILCALLKQPYEQIIGTAARNRGGLAFDWDFSVPVHQLSVMLRLLNRSKQNQ